MTLCLSLKFLLQLQEQNLLKKKRGKLDFIKMKSFHSDTHIILKVVLGYSSVDEPLPNIPKTLSTNSSMGEGRKGKSRDDRWKTFAKYTWPKTALKCNNKKIIQILEKDQRSE